MKPTIKNLAITAVLGTTMTLHAASTLLPNGDFETPDGATWAEVSADGTFAYDYPVSGGNPDGYGVIDHSAADGGWGIWVSNDEVPVTLDSLGLNAGEAYQFTQDMTILSGSNLGGFKVDFFNGTESAGSTGDIFPALIGDGTTWETYSFQVAIPATADGIKVVPLWGPDSTVGYDNVCVDPTPVPQPQIPNGDFENGGASWFEIGEEHTMWTYPSTGGNPDGYGTMDNDSEGFGIWVANGGAPLALDSLGLAGGDVVTFLQDMTILAGENIGGLKIEFLEGATFLGDTGDMIPDLIGDGSTWETYSFEVTLPSNADHIKIVPLWGVGSLVGYDNVGFVAPVPEIFAAAINTGTVVSWMPDSAESTYQPQQSEDNSVWTNLGPAILGDTISSVFDADGAPFYRVEESELVPLFAVINSGFENYDAEDPPHPDSWDCIGSQPPTLNTEDAHTDETSMRLAVINAASEANTSEIQQNIANVGGEIEPGAEYVFSFWAKQVSSGVSHVQEYRVQWLGEDGAILGGGVGFNNFQGGFGVWEEIIATGLVAPENAATALIQIIGKTGGVEGGLGEVLIDDVELITTIASPIGTLPATAAAGVEISWDSKTGRTYQVRSSTDLISFEDFGGALTGDGETQTTTDLITPIAKFYEVVETP